MAHVCAGLSFGEMALLQRGPRSASVIADMPTVCFEIPFEALDADEMRGVRKTLLANLALDLAERLRHANEEIRSLA